MSVSFASNGQSIRVPIRIGTPTGCQESVLTTLGPNLIRELDKCSLDPEH